MKAAVLYKNNDVKIEKWNIDDPLTNEVTIKVAYSGICGSDLPRLFNDGARSYPIVLGHEFSGEVVAVGSNVKEYKLGDKVACAPLVPCMECKDCKKGYYSQCKNYSFIGSRRQGGFAERVNIPSFSAFKLPNGVTLKEGAFFEPLTVALHGLKLFNYCAGKDVAIIGGGTIGLLALQSCNSLGAKSVTVIDITDEKLELAKKLGAKSVVNSMKEKLPENRFDLVIETAGVPSTFKACLHCAGSKGEVLFIGTPHVPLTFTQNEFEQINRKELTIKGSWMNYSIDYPGEEWNLANELFRNNKIEIDSLIDRVCSLNEFSELVGNYQNENIKGKVLIKMEG